MVYTFSRGSLTVYGLSLFELLKKKRVLGTVLFSDNQKHQVTVHKTRTIPDRMSLNSDAVSEENCSIVSGKWTTRQGTLHGV